VGHGSAHLAHQLPGVQTDLDPIVEQSEEGRKGEGGDEDRDEAELQDCRHATRGVSESKRTVSKTRVAVSEVKCPAATFSKFPTPAFQKLQTSTPTPQHNVNEIWLSAILLHLAIN